jgi:hypothetical protein
VYDAGAGGVFRAITVVGVMAVLAAGGALVARPEPASAMPRRPDPRFAVAAVPSDRLSTEGMVTLRALQRIVREQAGRLQRDVAGCRGRRGAGRSSGAARSRQQCLFMALVHAGAGARLNVVFLTALSSEVAGGPCQRLLGRYASLVGGLGFISRDAVRQRFRAPGYLVAAARASVRLAAAGAAAGGGPGWRRDCAPSAVAGPFLEASPVA